MVLYKCNKYNYLSHKNRKNPCIRILFNLKNNNIIDKWKQKQQLLNSKDIEINKLYKNRLARFGFELIEDLIKEYSNGRIIILNKNKDLEPEEELVKDVLQIMNIFTAKMNELRKYKEKD